MDKKRDLTTGKVTVLGISRSVKGADIIIVDDMIVTGDTLVETAKYYGKNMPFSHGLRNASSVCTRSSEAS